MKVSEQIILASKIRLFEDYLLDLFDAGKLSGTTHTSKGQECNAVGVASACKSEAIFVSNHRCHAHFIASGGKFEDLLFEILGDKRGVCGGLGGSQHLCNPFQFYSNGIQGGILPLAAGLSFSILKGFCNQKKAVVVFVGDGTLGEGVLYETLNISKILNLPLMIVVEDNEIAQTTPSHKTISGSIEKRFSAFGWNVKRLQYPNSIEVEETVNSLLPTVIDGKPCALIIKSTRLGPHSKGDDTRPVSELDRLNKIDPLTNMINNISDKEKEKLSIELKKFKDELSGILSSNYQEPIEPKIDEVKINFSVENFLEIDGRPFVERINNVIKDYLLTEDVYFIGEDINDPYGGAFKVSKNLQKAFPEKFFSTPISEAGFSGLAFGASLLGMKPIVELMFADFATLAADQIINHAAKYHLMYNNKVNCPSIIRLPSGGGRGYGPTHSQSLENLFTGIPGLSVFAMSSMLPASCFYDLIKNLKSPIILIEDKIDYARRINLKNFPLDIDPNTSENVIIFKDKNISNTEIDLICYGAGIYSAIEAQQYLINELEIDIGIIAVPRIYPLKLNDLKNYFQKKKFIISFDHANNSYAFNSEVISQLIILGYDGKISKISAPDQIIPASFGLEKKLSVDKFDIIKEVKSYNV